MTSNQENALLILIVAIEEDDIPKLCVISMELNMCTVFHISTQLNIGGRTEEAAVNIMLITMAS